MLLISSNSEALYCLVSFDPSEAQLPTKWKPNIVPTIVKIKRFQEKVLEPPT